MVRACAHQRTSSNIWEERSPDPGRSLRAVALGTLLDVAANIRARLGGVPTPDVAAAYEMPSHRCTSRPPGADA